MSLASSPTALAKTWAHAYATGILNEGSFALFRAASDGGYFVMLTPNALSPSAVASRGRKPRSNSVFTSVCGTFNYPDTILLLKAGSDGTLQWANRYQLGRGCTVGQDLAATSDGGAAIVASVLPDFGNSGNSGDEESAVLRIDANGGIVWQTGFQPVLSLDSIAARTDGSIVVAGGPFVIFLTPGGSLASFDSFPIFGGGITAIALFPDGYAFAAPDCILNSDGGCGATTPLIVRVGANPWTVHLPFIDNYEQFERPYALVAAPDGSMIVQSNMGRDARIDPRGAIVWDQIGQPDFDIRNPYPGAVDASGVFWRQGSALRAAPGNYGSYLHRIAPDGSSSDLLVGSTFLGPYGVVVAPSGQMAFLGEDFSETSRQVIVAIDPSDQGCLAQRSPADPMQPGSFSTSGIPATYYVPGDAVSPMTIPITAVRNCMAVASADLCAVPASQGRWTPAAEQAPGGGCPSTLVFSFDLDPATVIASPNPWNTPAIARVLTHKYGSDDAYPSKYQIDRQDVTLHPRFKFPGLARNGNGQAVNIWFRTIDPPDTAPYVVNGQDAHDNDNKDTSFSGGKGILMTPTCTDVSATSTCAALNGNVLATTTASDGTVQVVLETTDRFAGDNYQILASFSAPGADGKFPCEATTPNTCAKSAPITAWKRVYLENQRMFQHGAYLAESARTTGDTFIVVDISPFRQGQQVRFVHAPAGPRQLPSTQSQYYFDDGVIATGGVTPFPDGVGGTIKLQAAFPATHPYFGRPPQLSQIRPPVDQGDYVGIVTGDDLRDFWAANSDYVTPLFAAAFVEYTPASTRVTDLPFVNELGDRSSENDEVALFVKRWFEGMGLSNYQHLMGVSDTSSCSDPNQPARATTRAKWDYGSSYDCVPRILGRRIVTQSSVRLLGAVTAHEIAHQWHVDPRGEYSRSADADSNEHDNLFRFDNPGLFCLMHYRYDDNQQNILPEFTDGLAVFHYKSDASGVDSEYRWVRERCEPVPYRYPTPGADWWTVPAATCN